MIVARRSYKGFMGFGGLSIPNFPSINSVLDANRVAILNAVVPGANAKWAYAEGTTHGWQLLLSDPYFSKATINGLPLGAYLEDLAATNAQIMSLVDQWNFVNPGGTTAIAPYSVDMSIKISNLLSNYSGFNRQLENAKQAIYSARQTDVAAGQAAIDEQRAELQRQIDAAKALQAEAQRAADSAQANADAQLAAESQRIADEARARIDAAEYEKASLQEGFETEKASLTERFETEVSSLTSKIGTAHVIAAAAVGGAGLLWFFGRKNK